MAYLGLDVGTAGSKATVIDADGRIRATAYGEYKALRTDAGYAELQPESVWNTVKTVIAQATSEAGTSVKAISVASFGESFVMMGKSDRILRNIMLYADVRGADEVDDILQNIDARELFEETGMPVNPMYTLNKLLWIRKHEPKIFENIEKILLIEDYIFYMLSGERYVDFSVGSRTLLFDVKGNRWSRRIMDVFGLEEKWFSKPVKSGEVIGKISKTMAFELGLSEEVLLVSGAHDQVCAALGAGVLETGQCVDGIGTSECITALLGGFDHKERMRESNFCIEPYVLAGRHVTLAFSATGASLFGWYCDNFVAAGSESGPSKYAVMESECPPGPTSLFVLPHLSGSGTPYMDPFASGAVLGLRLSTTRGDIYKACMEGLCFEMRFNAELLAGIGTKISDMTCVGGGARSDMLMQIKADIMGIPVRRLKAKESGTIALAMLCATACGDYAQLAEASESMISVDRFYMPDIKAHKAYDDRYNTYKNIYRNLKNIT